MNLFEHAQQQEKPKDPPKPKPDLQRSKDSVSYRRGNDTSTAGAMDAMLSGKSADQMTRYITLLVKAGGEGLTDHEAAEAMGLPVGTICARRGSPHGKKYIVDSGQRRKGPTGIRNKVWVHVLKMKEVQK